MFFIVTIDRKYDKYCSTGKFELLYKQPNIPEPNGIDKAMLIVGHKVKQNKGSFSVYSIKVDVFDIYINFKSSNSYLHFIFLGLQLTYSKISILK